MDLLILRELRIGFAQVLILRCLAIMGRRTRAFRLGPLWHSDLPQHLAMTLKVSRPALNGTRATRSGKRHAEDGDVAGQEMGRELRQNMQEYIILSIS